MGRQMKGKKLIALIAVCAAALAGCGRAAPQPAPSGGDAPSAARASENPSVAPAAESGSSFAGVSGSAEIRLDFDPDHIDHVAVVSNQAAPGAKMSTKQEQFDATHKKAVSRKDIAAIAGWFAGYTYRRDDTLPDGVGWLYQVTFYYGNGSVMTVYPGDNPMISLIENQKTTNIGCHTDIQMDLAKLGEIIWSLPPEEMPSS